MKKVIGIEIIPSAIDNCKTNLKINNLEEEKDKFEFLVGKCEEILPALSKKIQGSKIVAIVDPPWSGLHTDVLWAMRCCPGLDRIIYVSCNANSMGENLVQLCLPESKNRRAPGFEIMKFCGADLFPYSDHVECIALLDRSYI